MTATIRTFRAPGAREALEAIKAAMGPDAVILGTREVKGGFFRKSEVEVTAALPHAAPPGAKVADAYAHPFTLSGAAPEEPRSRRVSPELEGSEPEYAGPKGSAAGSRAPAISASPPGLQ